MKSSPILFIAFCLFALLPTTVIAQAENGLPQKFGWVMDLDQGKALAKKTGKPIFLVFRCVP